MAEAVECSKCGKVAYTTSPEFARCPYCGHSPGGNPGPKPLTSKRGKEQKKD